MGEHRTVEIEDRSKIVTLDLDRGDAVPGWWVVSLKGNELGYVKETGLNWTVETIDGAEALVRSLQAACESLVYYQSNQPPEVSE